MPRPDVHSISVGTTFLKRKESDEEVWYDILEENSVDEEHHDQALSTTLTHFLLNTISSALTYAANNPFKTLTLALAAYSVVNRGNVLEVLLENSSSAFSNGIDTATNVLTKLAVAKVATNGMYASTPMNAMIAGMSLWNPVAATTTSPEFQVNTYTVGDQASPSVASFPNGNFVVVWNGAGAEDSSGIYARCFNGTGGALGAQFLINTYAANDQRYTSVATFPNGNFVVAWYGEGQGDNYGVYGQRFDGTTRTPLGSAFLVNTYTPNNQLYPSIASFPNGNFVVVWQSYLAQDGSDWGVYGQLFDSTGTKLGTEFQINTYAVDDQSQQAVASFQDGSFVVVWQSRHQDGSGFGIYGQRLNATGAKLGTEFRVNTYTNNDQCDPSVAIFPNGNFVVTWYGEGQGDSYGVYGQRFDGTTGGKLGPEFLVNNYTANNQIYPSVATFPNGNFVVTWFGYGAQDTSVTGIYGQQFDGATSAKIGSEFLVNVYTTNTQQYPWTASFLDGSFVVTWESNGQDGSGYGVYARIFYLNNTHTGSPSPSPTPLPTSLPLSPSSPFSIFGQPVSIQNLTDLFISLGALSLAIGITAAGHYRYVIVPRKKYPLAMRVAEHLGLTLFYKVGFGNGIKFAEKMDAIVEKLSRKPNFTDIYSIRANAPQKFEALAKAIADAIQQTLATYQDDIHCVGAIKGKKLKPQEMTEDNLTTNFPGKISLIADTTEKFYKNGRAIYLMEASAIPTNLSAHKVSYIFVIDQQSQAPASLFYIDYKAEAQKLELIVNDEEKNRLSVVLNRAGNTQRPLQEILTKDELQWFWKKVRANAGHFEQVIDGVYQNFVSTVDRRCCHNKFSFFQPRSQQATSGGITLSRVTAQDELVQRAPQLAQVIVSGEPSGSSDAIQLTTHAGQELLPNDSYDRVPLLKPMPLHSAGLFEGLELSHGTAQSQPRLSQDNDSGAGAAPVFRK
jgi:hypothetical protein